MWAFWRFLCVVLAYGLFSCDNVILIASTTVAYCVFLILKVVIMAPTDAIGIALLVVSFVLTWIEVFMLDFKVLPFEEKQRKMELLRQQSSSYSERDPLLPNAVSARSYISQYHSVAGSIFESDSGSPPHPSSSSLPAQLQAAPDDAVTPSLDRIQRSDFRTLATHCWFETMQLVRDVTDWRLTAGTDAASGWMLAKTDAQTGKLFKLEALIECSADDLFKELIVNIKDAKMWNPTILDGEVLERLDSTTDVCYTVTADAAGGLVRSRDFVTLRHWKWDDDVLLSAGVGVEHPLRPACPQYVRGHNRPSGMAFARVPGHAHCCQFTWIINTDLKGWLPKSAVDQGLQGYAMDFLRFLRKRVKDRYSAEQEV